MVVENLNHATPLGTIQSPRVDRVRHLGMIGLTLVMDKILVRKVTLKDFYLLI